MNDITGGDLHALWRTANVLLPSMGHYYAEASSKLGSGQNGMVEPFSAGEAEYGRTFYSPILTSFHNLYSEFQHILATSSSNVYATAESVNRALESFKTQDSGAASELEDILDDGWADGKQVATPEQPFEDPARPVEPGYYSSPGDTPTKDADAENEDIADAKSTLSEMTEEADEKDGD